jgi:hypothetical protein
MCTFFCKLLQGWVESKSYLHQKSSSDDLKHGNEAINARMKIFKSKIPLVCLVG